MKGGALRLEKGRKRISKINCRDQIAPQKGRSHQGKGETPGRLEKFERNFTVGEKGS